MQLDRRQRKLRRALGGGVLLGLLSILPLWIFELIWLLVVARPSFDSTFQAIAFLGVLLAVPAALMVIIGAFEGLLILGIGALARWLAQRRLAEGRWTALLYAVVCAPFIAAGAAQVFAGRRAQQIPGKDLLALALGMLGVLACYGLARVAVGARDRLRIRRWGPREANLIAAGLVALALGAYVADQMVLPGLYAFFHAGLTLIAVGLLQLACGAIHAGWRARLRWIGRLAAPRTVLVLSVVAITAGAWGLRRMGWAEQDRYVAHRYTSFGRKVLGLAGALGLTRTGSAALPVIADAPMTESRTQQQGPRVPEANLLLISVDALRADHMGLYGYRRGTTPHIDRWSKGAVVFERGYCPVPHTSFSLTSLMTAKHLYSTGAGRYPTIPRLLRRFGYKTGGFFPPAVFYIDGDRFRAYRSSLFDFEYVKFEFLDARLRVDQIFAFLKDNPSQKFFIWVHFFEPHEPYDFRREHDFGQQAVDRYDGEIAYVDAQIGRLIRGVRKQRPQTIIALTGDHGEAFGEHGAFYHGNSLYEEQIRVPVMIETPGVQGRRVDAAAQTIDLPVTMLSMVDVPIPAEMNGRDLGPWLAGEDPASLGPAFVQIDQQKAVIHRSKKLIKDDIRGFRELYDLQADPRETRNILGRQPRLAAELVAWLTRLSSRQSAGEAGRRMSGFERLIARATKRDPGAVPGLLRLCAGSVEERRAALRMLVALRAREASAAFTRALTDSDPEARMQATIGLALLGDRKQLEHVAALRRRDDLPPAMRQDVLIALARAGDRSATGDLGAILDRTEDIYQRLEMIEALGELGDPAAARALRGQMKTLRTRLYATRALGKLRARSAVPELITSVRNDRYVSWRVAAARALGLIGDRRATGDLQRVVEHEAERAVVGEALAALRQLGGLSTRGVRALSARGWRCAGDVCDLDLAAPCGGSDELLLLLGKRRGAVHVLCGTQDVGALEPPRRGEDQQLAPVLVLPLTKGRGALRLRTTAPAPDLDFVGLRRMPGTATAAR